MTKKHSEKKTVDISDTTLAEEPLPVPAADELDQLRTDAAKATENWDKLLRATADFENFKKRAARERQEAIQYANAGLFQKLIPVLDNFEMALAATAAGAPAASVQSMQAGVNMIASQLRTALVESGLEEIDATGQPFDPNFHEAVSQQETADVPEGHVLQQLRKGYKLRDRLLRPATVIVAKKPSSPADPSEPPAGA
jgi:molecular chaperone GrpE